MDLKEVALADITLELRHGVNEGCALNVTDGTAYFPPLSAKCPRAEVRQAISRTELNNADVWLLARVVDGDPGNTLDPFLNGTSDMRHDLHRLAQVIASALGSNDLLVDLASRDVVVPSESNVQVALVVAEVEIAFAAIVENVALAVSKWC